MDLFCGAGGFSTGFSNAGYKILAGADNNEDALNSYNLSHDATGHNIDLSTVTADEMLERMDVSRESVDGIIGGPPCQGFSQAGDQIPDDPRNQLVFNYFDFIEEIEPKFFVMENVRGILYDRNSHVIDYIENRSEEMGYDIEFEVLNAADYGVAQTRKRVIIVGVLDGEAELPEPTHEDNWVGVEEVVPGPIPEGQIVSSYGIQETLRGERATRQIDEPCYTICASRALIDVIPNDYEPREDVPSITDVRIYRFDEEDAAAVQSFPDGYEFVGNLTSQRRQIGNAIPPKLAESIGNKIKEIFARLTVEESMLILPSGTRVPLNGRTITSLDVPQWVGVSLDKNSFELTSDAK